MLFILIIISFFGCVFSQDFIQEPNIIQLGEYTNLISILNSTNYLDILKNYIFTWYYIDTNNTSNFIINIKNDKTYHYSNSIKFKTFTIDNKIILQIKNITEDDKNNTYYCYYENDKQQPYENKFANLTDLKFFNPFSSKNMEIKYFSNNININFKKIFPIPKCFVKLNNESFFPENSIQNKTLDYLYYQVNLSMKINYSDEIKIICTLLNQNFTINSNDDIYMYNNLNTSIIITIIILFLISGIILLIFIYLKRKDPKKRKEILYSLINKIKT